MAKADLTAQRLRELLHYDPESGVFTWRVSYPRSPAGKVAGCFNRGGYRCIRIDGKLLRANRLAWLYVHGHWPENHVDHIDGDRANDRFANLRDVTQSVNMQNLRRALRNNRSGLLGAGWQSSVGKWRAQIKVQGVLHILGLYETPEEAHAVYLVAKRRLHEGCMI